MDAYEEMIANTSTPHAPWFVIPADNKWFTRLAVAAAVVDALDELDLAYPKVDAQKQKELAAARKLLLEEQAQLMEDGRDARPPSRLTLIAAASPSRC